MHNPVLIFKPGAIYEGVQLFSLTFQCDECQLRHIVYIGPLDRMPMNMALAELLVETEELHRCPPVEERTWLQ